MNLLNKLITYVYRCDPSVSRDLPLPAVTLCHVCQREVGDNKAYKQQSKFYFCSEECYHFC